MNKHDKISKLLAASALGELSPETQAEVKTHLTECHQCRSEFKRLQTLLECTGRIKELSSDARMCESAKQAVFTAVESEKNESSPGPNAGPELIWRTIMYSKTMKLAAAAVIAIVVLGGISFWPGSPQNSKWWLAPPRRMGTGNYRRTGKNRSSGLPRSSSFCRPIRLHTCFRHLEQKLRGQRQVS